MFIMEQRPPSVALGRMGRSSLLLFVLMVCTSGIFPFNQPAQLLLTSIATNISTIQAETPYTFSFSRFSAAPIPINSYLLLNFNSQYAGQVPSTPTCSVTGLGSLSLTPACSFSANALYVSHIFLNGSLLTSTSFTLSVSNITNPSPAGTYVPVSSLAILTPNSSVFQSGSASVAVTITGGTATCLTTITNAYVFQGGQVAVTYNSPYIASPTSNYDIFVSIPTTYPDDLTGTSLNASLSLSSTLSFYPGVNIYQAAFASSFTITMLMPPSTKPVTNFISIYTQTSIGTGTVGLIDSCSLTIANIQPNTFTSIAISKGTVQTTATLAFDLTLSTPLFQSDTLNITFPSGFTLTAVGSSVSIASYGVLTLTRYDRTCLISSIPSQPVLSARLIFSISGIGMPFTTAPTSIAVSLGTSGNYSRIVQDYPYAPAPGALNVSVTCLNTEIGTINTRCLFSFRTVSQLGAGASLNVMFPSIFPLGSASQPCALSGSGLNSNLNCIYTSSNNTITATPLSPSSANILPIPITINVTVNMSHNVDNYTLTLSTQTQDVTVDLGYVTLATTARLLKPAQFSMTSSSSTTNSPTTYTLFFSLPFDLGVTYTVLVTIPFSVQSGLSVSVSGGTLVSFSGGILRFTASQLTNNASISISNLLTAVSLQPAVISVQVMFQSVTYFTGSATIVMTQIRQFSLATVAQSNQIVFAPAIATITLGGLSNGDKLVLTGNYSGFYQSSQPNCSSTVVSCGVAGVLTVLAANTSGTTTFSINIQNLGYVGQAQLNITSYDSAQNYAKLSSAVTLSATTPNLINITANQTNPYLSEPTTYTFSLRFTTPNPLVLLITPPAGLLVTAATCLLNCGNATKLIGYYFPVSSTNCIVTFSLTNPSAFGSAIKFVFKTSNSLGDMDYGDYSPQLVCPSPCRSCLNGSSICLTCYSWSSQTVLYNNTCITSCPFGLYQTLSSGVSVCSPCSSLCTVCSGSSSNCSSCRSGIFLYNLGCYQSCPVGTYTSSSNICITCLQDNCSVCNATTCTACFATFSFFNGSCLSTCLSNYYSFNGNCVPCETTCLVCSPTNGSCSYCLSPNLLYGGMCYTSCPAGVFQQLNNNLCQVCQAPCASCSVYSTNCTSCLRTFNGSNYFYLANVCYQTQCPNGYFGNTNSQCIVCPSGCSSCLSSACLNCSSSLFLYQGGCYAQCPNGTYQGSSNCVGCSSICSTCLSATVCTSCIWGYNLFNSSCMLTCPAFYYSGPGSICLPCNFPCGLCNSLGCLNCADSYYLQQTICTPSCTGNFRPNNSTMVCESCRIPCLGCTWSTSCTSCVSGYSLLGTSCLSSCPTGYYSNGAQCLLCPGNCTTCTFMNNQPACTGCTGTLLLYSFNCVADCPNSTLPTNGFCVSQDCENLPHCTSCAGTQCLQCASLYTMDSSYSCSQYVTASSIANALLGIPVPFPFLIAIVMVIIISFLLKHNFPKMFSPLFIYAIAGCFQFLCLFLWTLLSVSWNLGLQQPLPYSSVVYAPVLIGCIYVVFNILQFFLWYRRVVPDRQYKLWEKQDNRCASLSIAIVSLIFSFRLDALKFSRTGHNPHLSARVSSPEVFTHYSALAVLSLLLSGVSVVVSVYVSYLQTTLNYLFFTGFQVAIIAIIMIILSLTVLCVSRAQLLEDRTEYQVGYDQDQIEGKSVEELLNGLGIVQEHHENNHYDETGNAVLMKNQYSSEHYSQDLTLIEPAQHLAFQEKADSQIELGSQDSNIVLERKVKGPTQRQGMVGDAIFGEEAEISSDNHILIDQFERDKNEALELTKHYGLAEQPASSTYPRQSGAIVKQRLPSLHQDTSEMESVGSFEQFAVDITKGKWKKHAPPLLAGESVEPQGDFIEEFQIKQIFEEKLKQEQAERQKQQEERERLEAEQRKQEEAERQRQQEIKERIEAQRRKKEEAERRKQQEEKEKVEAELRRQEELRRRVEELKQQEILKEQERQKELERQEQLARQEQRRKQEQAEREKKRIQEERLRKIEAQKQREEQWRLKKEEARLQKIREERLLKEKMERLRREEEELRRRMKEEEERELARIEELRLQQLEQSRKQIERINKLKAELEALQGITEQFEAKNLELEKEQAELRLHEEDRQRQSRERGLMAVEDRLSRMAIVFEDMWKKAAEIQHRPPRRIRNTEEKPSAIYPIQYHNPDQENLISELSPRKIKVSPRPLPEQYTRKHLFLEQGKEILESGSSEEELEEEELEIVFEGEGKMQEDQRVDKPKSILQHHRPNKAKIDHLHYHDLDKKEIEELKLKHSFNKTVMQNEARKSSPRRKEMPKEDTEDPIAMVFEDKMAQVLEEEEPEEDKSSLWSHPSKQEEEKGYDPLDIEYVGRSIHSSSETHWPIEPQMQERILEIQRRADRYISEPPKKESSRRYVEVTPEDRIYEQEEDQEAETQLGEIVFEEFDQILENESRATGTGRSPPSSSSGRRRYPMGRVNRMVIDLSPRK